uniref:U1-type domain-containing protein n=1 Tax=Aegilops tauschii TaxID=37682 RepID=M8BLS1_AEGTA
MDEGIKSGKSLSLGLPESPQAWCCGLTNSYFTAGEASQAPSAAQTAPAASAAAAAGREAVKHFGFDPQRYAQLVFVLVMSKLKKKSKLKFRILEDVKAWNLIPVLTLTSTCIPSTTEVPYAAPQGQVRVRLLLVAAAKAPNGVAPTAAATVMHHAQWNAHFGHPLPTNVRRSFRKKTPKVVQPLLCEVCKIQCDTMEVLLIHKTGQKHKKNLQKLQDAITPQPAKPPNSGVAANTAPPAAAAAAADGVVPAVQPKKNKSSNASPANLEVKKRRVIEAGAAHGEMKICTACNVVVNSQKVYEFHLAGQKHKANVLKQQKQQQQQQQQQQVQLQHVA